MVYKTYRQRSRKDKQKRREWRGQETHGPTDLRLVDVFDNDLPPIARPRVSSLVERIKAGVRVDVPAVGGVLLPMKDERNEYGC
jgi:hypothetical protein